MVTVVVSEVEIEAASEEAEAVSEIEAVSEVETEVVSVVASEAEVDIEQPRPTCLSDQRIADSIDACLFNHELIISR